MVESILRTLESVWHWLALVLCTWWGKLCALALMAISFFEPIERLSWLLALFAIVDMVLGLAVKIRHKGTKSILSNRLRDTAIKIAFYVLLISLLFTIEGQWSGDTQFSALSLFSIFAVSEFISILVNICVLSPKVPIFKLVLKKFAQEGAKKLDMDLEEFCKYINIEIPTKK